MPPLSFADYVNVNTMSPFSDDLKPNASLWSCSPMLPTTSSSMLYPHTSANNCNDGIGFGSNVGWAQHCQWNQNKATGSRRRVTFGRTSVVEHTHIAEFSRQEVDACWYRSEDYRQFRDADNQAIDRIRQQKQAEMSDEELHFADNDSEFESRDVDDSVMGLESAISSRYTWQRMRDANRSVLEEQECQRYEGSYDPDYMARRYAAFASTCRDQARSVGAQHALEAMAVI